MSQTRNDLKREKTRASLILGARQVMAEKGIEATTIREIAEAADVAYGNFYNYFGSKEEIVTIAAGEILGEITSAIDGMNELLDDPVEVLACAISAFLRMFQMDPIMTQFLLLAESFDTQIEKKAREPMIRDLGIAVAAKRLEIQNVETMSQMMTGALIGYMRGRILGDVDATEDGQAIYRVLLMIGVSPDEAQELADKYSSPVSNEN